MPWQLAIAVSMLALVATVLIRRHHAQKSLAPPSFPPAIAYTLGVAPLGLFAGLVLFPHHVLWTWRIVSLLLLIAVSMAISNWLNFKAIKRQPITQYQLIGESQTVMIIALGWIILGETLTHNQLLGAVLLLVAAALAILAPIRQLKASDRNVHSTAVLLNLGSCLAGAIGLVTEKAALGHMDIGAYLIFGYSAQALGMLALASKDVTRATLKKLTKDEVRWSASMGLANGSAGVLYVYALVHSNNISLIASLSAVMLPLTVLGAYLFLHEKENLKILWGALALGFIGLLVLALH